MSFPKSKDFPFSGYHLSFPFLLILIVFETLNVITSFLDNCIYYHGEYMKVELGITHIK